MIKFLCTDQLYASYGLGGRGKLYSYLKMNFKGFSHFVALEKDSGHRGIFLELAAETTAKKLQF